MTTGIFNSPRARSCFVGIVLSFTWELASSAGVAVHGTTVATVAVNGGADTSNPGTTCIQLIAAPIAVCTGGWISIPNNNKQLLSLIERGN